MSLINDALQRAKQQPVHPAAASNLQLRPMEPAPVEKKGWGITVSIVATILIVAAALISGWYQRNRTSQAQVQATPPPPASQPVAAVVPALAPAAVAVAHSPSTTETKPLAVTPETVASSPTPVEIAAPKPAPIKLQAILFNKTKPSAIINGKTVYVGNHLGEFQVASITQTSATLISSTATNILSFEE
jgi:hypothetical protein